MQDGDHIDKWVGEYFNVVAPENCKIQISVEREGVKVEEDCKVPADISALIFFF